ncbi:hypothetical protein ACOMHN_042637 [Nucella lapillus]
MSSYQWEQWVEEDRVYQNWPGLSLEYQTGSRYLQRTHGPGHCGWQVQPGLTAARRRTGQKCGAPEGASPCHRVPGDRRCQPQASRPVGSLLGSGPGLSGVRRGGTLSRGNPIERDLRDRPAQTPVPLPTEFAGSEQVSHRE